MLLEPLMENACVDKQNPTKSLFETIVKKEQKTMRYSLICCWNDPKQLQELLLDSYTHVYNQEEKPTLLLIDNSANKYKSAAEAFNSEYEAHKQELDDILIFLHQDIAFDNASSSLDISPESLLPAFAAFANLAAFAAFSILATFIPAAVSEISVSSSIVLSTLWPVISFK